MTRPSRERLGAAAAIAAIAAVAVVAYALAGPERYEAEAAIEVTPVAADDETFAGFSVLREGQDAVDTAAQLLETRPVADAVAVRLRLDGPGEALDRVEADADARGRIVRVRGSAPKATEAAQVANAFADELIRQRSSLFQTDLRRTLDTLRAELANVPASRRDEPPASDTVRRLSELRRYTNLGDPTLRVAGTATAPRDPAWPKPLPILALGLPLALLLGALVALLPTGRPPAPVAPPALRAPPAPSALAQPAAAEISKREQNLNERIETITAREREVARRAAGLTLRERDLDTRDAAVRERDLVGRANELALERREQELLEREEALRDREQAFAERSAVQRAAQPPVRESGPGEGSPAPAADAPGAFTIAALEHAVDARAPTLSPERYDELHAYLVFLRGFAAADGTLPRSFDSLVNDVFGELLSS